MDISNFFIDEGYTVIQAMKQLDEVAMKVLFVQADGTLKAALTDGDIRRWILSNGDLKASVGDVANYSPLYLKYGTREQALQFLRDKGIEAVPIVDDNLKILNIVTRSDREYVKVNEQITAPVVMMAGGKGTRLYPYTKVLPKPLIPVGDLPIAEHIINQFVTYGCKDFYLIVNHKKNMIKAYFNEIDKNYNIYYFDEETPLGTGGGLFLLKGSIHETFILTNCDILVKEDITKIYNFHKKSNNVITIVCSLQNFQVPYGIVHISDGGGLDAMEEKPTMSFFTNTGCYIVEPEVIEELDGNQAVDFPEIVEKYKKCGRNIGIFPVSEKAWLDMGQMDGLEKMKSYLET